jgi:hypothetical protein
MYVYNLYTYFDNAHTAIYIYIYIYIYIFYNLVFSIYASRNRVNRVKVSKLCYQK